MHITHFGYFGFVLAFFCENIFFVSSIQLFRATPDINFWLWKWLGLEFYQRTFNWNYYPCTLPFRQVTETHLGIAFSSTGARSSNGLQRHGTTWWRHQMETFSALLAICAGNSPVTGEFPTQRPVTRSFGVFFDLCLNKRLSKQSWGWWFETPSRPLWCHCYEDNCSINDRQMACPIESRSIEIMTRIAGGCIWWHFRPVTPYMVPHIFVNNSCGTLKTVFGAVSGDNFL